MSDLLVGRGTEEASRSLWQDAWRRLRMHGLGLYSLYFLLCMALVCIVGPWVLSNAYDRSFLDYSRLDPSFSSYPTDEQMQPALEKIAGRLRAQISAQSQTSDHLTLSLQSPRAIDKRSLVYFERSDFFGPAQIISKSDDDKQMQLNVPIIRRYFPFGTDSNGRDLLTRTLIAGRVSLSAGLLASLVALGIGVSWGAFAGLKGGKTDNLMMRLVDVLYALPFMFLVVLLVVVFGRNFLLIFMAIGAIEWLDMARIVRGQTLSLKHQEFVTAAEALGVGQMGILRRHIVPNLAGTVIVYLTLQVPKVMLLESFLSFLGLGVQEPLTSWGVLISEGAHSIESGPWRLIIPVLFLTSTLFALNFLGDGLRDALDPKDR